MRHIILKEEENHLFFIEDGEEIYSIPISALAETRIEGEIVFSEWISHLNEYLWASPDLLYRLAKIIKSRFPENNIDWQETFHDVERKDYLEKHYDLSNEFEEEALKPSEEFMKRVKHGQQESSSEISAEIDRLVLENLTHHGIL